MSIHLLLIICKVKNFTDINRQVNAEKCVYVFVKNCRLFFWNVDTVLLLYFILNKATLIFKNLCR
ncbi:hypothetical protein HMPREF1981_00922 [Bacteroides pyogenes F0041]|uniref:Uncharacterized protein n=1 Tax=Bacteroides pyogenes F0041 TaxID=1321819 RepID=U2DXL2_9BACE|nr:hypothetical protein HMPREF1981_00922 [Bacteroides pyogenes F0041]